jgi:hypothetical protein
LFDAVIFDREPSVALFRAGHAPSAVFAGGKAVVAATPFEPLVASDVGMDMLYT